jgi:hypothetical protein
LLLEPDRTVARPPILEPPVWTAGEQLTGAELGPYVSGVHDVQVAVTPPPLGDYLPVDLLGRSRPWSMRSSSDPSFPYSLRLA